MQCRVLCQKLPTVVKRMKLSGLDLGLGKGPSGCRVQAAGSTLRRGALQVDESRRRLLCYMY